MRKFEERRDSKLSSDAAAHGAKRRSSSKNLKSIIKGNVITCVGWI
jgi:hypothetical protein